MPCKRNGRPILPILALTAVLCLPQCSSDDNGGVGGTPDDGTPPTPKAQSISIGPNGKHTCAVVDGGVKCWGEGGGGRLGNGSSDDQSSPVDVVSADGSSTPLSGVTAISAGNDHTCALLTSGGVKCWGLGDDGRLGNGSSDEHDSPVDVVSADGSTDPLSGVTAISAGGSHTCALLTSGGVKCWGKGANGRLGDGNTGDHDSPVDVVSSGVTAVSAGTSHTCAVVSGGAQCWGYGRFGILGDGDTDNHSENRPQGVNNLGDGSGVTAVNAGDFHTCAVVSGGAKCWGYGGNGRLGDGDTMPNAILDDVDDLEDGSGVTAVGAGNLHTCAVVNGGVKCWGGGSLWPVGEREYL